MSYAIVDTQVLERPSLRDRLAARIWHRSLDQELAAGADPADCPRWAARAATLTGGPGREHTARVIDQLAGYQEVERWLRDERSAEAARANRDELRELARLLRRDKPLRVDALARLRLVLSDADGPVYTDRGGRALAHELGELHAALIC